MARSASCPRCGQALQPLDDLPGKLRCVACGVRCSVRSANADEPATPRTSNWGDGVLLITVLLAGLVLLAGAGWFVYRATLGRPEPASVAEVPPDSPPSPRVTPAPGPSPIEQYDLVLPKHGDARTLEPPEAEPAHAKPATPERLLVARLKSNEPAVNQAIDRGVAYLKGRLAAMLDTPGPTGGYRMGVLALGGLTLLECGVAVDDPLIQKTADAVRGADSISSYDLAVSVWFLARLGNERDRIRELALRMIAGQTVNGGWGYTCPPLSAKEQAVLLERLQTAGDAKIDRTVAALRYKPGDKLVMQEDVTDDNSITQFVVLALWIAREHEVPIARPLALVEGRFRASQNGDGSWGYFPSNSLGRERGIRRPDSMTCAGLMGLAVGRGARKVEGKAGEAVRDPVIDKAVAFLAKRLGKAGPLSETERQRFQEQHAAAKAQLDDWLVQIEKLQRIEEKVTRIVRLVDKRLAEYDKLPRAKQLEQAKEMKDLIENNKALIAPMQQEHKELISQLEKISPLDNGRAGRLTGAVAWGGLYYLWSLERMAVVYDWKTIGGVDWYAWGAELILASQNDDGSWADAFPGIPDTCFALLFLKRVNVAKTLTSELKIQGPIVIDGK
jgi:hypothetical protein